MNETMSVFLATTILALGGLGLYMYKSNNNDDYQSDAGSENSYNENTLFNGNFWGFDDDDNNDDNKLTKEKNHSKTKKYEDEEDYLSDEEYYEKPRKRQTKTHKNRQSSSKRRY
jgi:hypothetical protein